MRFVQNFIVFFFSAGAFLLLFLTLIPFLPSVLWPLELLSHFQTQYFLAAAIAVLSAVILRRTLPDLYFSKQLLRPLFLVPLLLALAVSFFSIAPYLPVRIIMGETVKGGETLTVLQSNVYKYNTDYAALLVHIETYNPDIIAVSEATPGWRDALLPLKEKDWPHMIDRAAPGSHGMVVLSRYPFIEKEVLYPSTKTHPVIFFRIRAQERDILLASLHPLSPMTARRYHSRDEDLAATAAYLEAHAKGNVSVIVTGDLNTTMFSPSYKQFIRETGLTNTRRGRGLYGSWPVFLPAPARIAIDHTLYKGELESVHFTTLPSINSDHLSTLAVFR
ncbi:MAG: endonuclease/exonuclease/phosphatase family protein [Micavibrio sp.]|nr:MAG: endonuclease/exonuclease/phosphatase family protein [Micavibrio sp.]